MTIQSIILIAISLVGAIYDLRFRRIPNWLTFGTFFLAIIYNLIQLSFVNIANCILGFFVGILFLIIPYLLGGMGAADVKLLGAIGSIIGYKDIILVFLYSGLSGIVLVFIWIIFTPGHLKFLITTGQILPTVDKKEKIPYGVAIFMGTILYIIYGAGYIFSYKIQIPSWQ